MVEQNTTNSVPITDPVPDRRARSLRTHGTHSSQDDVPHHATDRREPRRAGVAFEHARLCARIADDNRGKEILLLDLRKATPIVDFFVIITAVSRRLSHAIASQIDQEMKKLGEAKLGLEESEEGRWTLIDYGDFVVHIFSADDRAYYALEEIWGDAPQLDWQETPTVPSAVVPESQATRTADAQDESSR
jgi:ribosome-associated protein